MLISCATAVALERAIALETLALAIPAILQTSELPAMLVVFSFIPVPLHFSLHIRRCFLEFTNTFAQTLSQFWQFLGSKQNQNNQNADEVQIREQYQQFAENNLRWFLLRKSIISDKELSVSPNEVEDFIKDALVKNESQKAEIERFYKKESNKNKLSDDLLDQKIIDMLKEHSKIKEKDQKTSELQGSQPNL